MRDERPLAIALMGPTASGKTALALEWAGDMDTEIVSVDSALVYRGLDIGAAKPDHATLAAVKHHLVDVRDPHEVFSAADFAREALVPMRALAARGRVPLLVGGTGLYFSALLDGLSEMPQADQDLRAAIAAEAERHGWPALHAELARVDPEAAARIGVGDRQRITRALEVWRLSGRPISVWQKGGLGRQPFPFRLLKLVLAPADRSALHARITQRFDRMLAEGFLDEVRRLRADPRLHPDLPSMRAVGYRQAWEHLDGRTDAATFRARAIAATRQLAKRQYTWLRARPDAIWFDPGRDRARLERARADFLHPA
ncbi:tRNA (adenosine(37)-N6)-dimethylallyltransferase MiaA [Arenimonas fontis]|uniref:tRNA dimethylallyltransferase n=1 Tax=Arenimonas fontis TaxID=2608255 RepID=A0A5B2ZCE7_9GAMM|nr:tRNA (adenosine(37)-N6)-dimethylallyltransferase MiaA [Arenimonas fontis]KAA2285749.1 tRNA (adenosine(37)-N6)-dimethylallyltransferase MiaA [Arenimonas fontis]